MSKIQKALEDVRWFCSYLNDNDADKVFEMLSIVSSELSKLEAENTKLKEENERMRKAQDDWIKLPVDADGVPVHAGEELFWKEDGTSAGRVMAIGVDDRAGWVWLLHDGSNVSIGRQINKMCHAKSDTWESIIADAMRAGRADVAVNVMPLIKRCKALCERTREGEE